MDARATARDSQGRADLGGGSRNRGAQTIPSSGEATSGESSEGREERASRRPAGSVPSAERCRDSGEEKGARRAHDASSATPAPGEAPGRATAWGGRAAGPCSALPAATPAGAKGRRQASQRMRLTHGQRAGAMVAPRAAGAREDVARLGGAGRSSAREARAVRAAAGAALPRPHFRTRCRCAPAASYSPQRRPRPTSASRPPLPAFPPASLRRLAAPSSPQDPPSPPQVRAPPVCAPSLPSPPR